MIRLLTIFLITLTISAFAEYEVHEFELSKVKTEYDGEFFLRGECKELNVRVGIFPGHKCLISESDGKHFEQCEIVYELENATSICHQYFSDKYMVTIGTSKERPWEHSANCMQIKRSSSNNIQKDVQK